MISFPRRYWGRLLLVFVILGLIFSYYFSSPDQKKYYFNRIFQKTQYILRPASLGITKIQHLISYQFEFYLRQSVINREIVFLRKENTALRKKIKELRIAEDEANRLRGLLNLKTNKENQTIASEVIGVSPSNYYLTLILDKGDRDGVRKNMVVINEEGVVGRVFQVVTRSSKVLLIGDQRSAIAVMEEKTKSRAILEGMGGGYCKLILEDPQIQIKIGDRIFTSGLGGIFPEGLYIGVVDQIQRDNRSGWATLIRVKPAADNYNIQEVLVIKNIYPPFSEQSNSVDEK